jgi:FkbM family methyltransferase
MIDRIREFWRQIDWYSSKYLLRKKIIRRTVHHMPMYLDLVTPGISKTLAIRRMREADKTLIVEEFLREGMVVLDCGSNIGYYPLLEASIVKQSGRVFAIEADPRHYELLAKNVALAPPNVIEVFRMAVSNTVGEVTMVLAEKSNLSRVASRTAPASDANPAETDTVTIPATTIDAFLCDHDVEPDFFRMDIEGHEVEVLQGMGGTLERAKRGFKILMELHPNTYSDTHNFAAELNKLFQMGFRARVIISAGGLRPKPFRDLGYRPAREIASDGFMRGWYEGVEEHHVVELTCSVPKVSRYVMLEKG